MTYDTIPQRAPNRVETWKARELRRIYTESSFFVLNVMVCVCVTGWESQGKRPDFREACIRPRSPQMMYTYCMVSTVSRCRTVSPATLTVFSCRTRQTVTPAQRSARQENARTAHTALRNTKPRVVPPAITHSCDSHCKLL